MSEKNNPPSEYFNGIYYNPSFFKDSEGISLEFGTKNYLSRIGTASSVATNTSFSGIVNANNGLNVTGGETVDSLNATTSLSVNGVNINTIYQTISAMSAYQTIANMINYLSKVEASNQYQQKSGMSNYLTLMGASLTYQKIIDMPMYLTSAAAGAIYLTISNASATYLSKVSASSQYQSIQGMSNYLTNYGASLTYLPKTGTAVSTADSTSFSGNVTVSGTLNNISSEIFSFLSGLTSNIQTQINNSNSNISTLQYNTIDILWTPGQINKTTIRNQCETTTLSFLNTLNGISPTTFGYLSGLTSNIQEFMNNKNNFTDIISQNIGNENTAFGLLSFSSNYSGGYNSAFGFNSLASNIGGAYCTAVGCNALQTSNAFGNTAVGYNALQTSNALGNTAVGYNAGKSNETGTYNTFLGYNANASQGVSNSTSVGSNSFCTASNQIMLGTASESVVVPGNLTFSNTLNNITPAVFAFLEGLTSNIQSTFDSIQSSFDSLPENFQTLIGANDFAIQVENTYAKKSASNVFTGSVNSFNNLIINGLKTANQITGFNNFQLEGINQTQIYN